MKSRKLWGPKISPLVFFQNNEKNMYSESINIECLNPTIYHHFVNKIHKSHIPKVWSRHHHHLKNNKKIMRIL